MSGENPGTVNIAASPCPPMARMSNSELLACCVRNRQLPHVPASYRRRPTFFREAPRSEPFQRGGSDIVGRSGLR